MNWFECLECGYDSAEARKWQCAVCGKYSDTKRGVCAPVRYK